jgi:hypothetical protein
MTENGRHKGTLSETFHKELRVVVSGNRSPLPLRIAKWALFLSIARRLYGTRWFRAWVFGLLVAGLATHFLYRHMTHAWTRPWGGWRDVEAGRPPGRDLKRRKEMDVALGTLCLAEIVTPASWRRDTRLTVTVTVTRANSGEQSATSDKRTWLK